MGSAVGNYCETGAVTKTVVKTVGGTAGKTYSINLRVRGVVEQKSYSGTTAGTATGAGASLFAVGGNPDSGNWNNYTFSVSSGTTTSYRLNNGDSGHDYCDRLDFTTTIKGVKANSSVKLEAISQAPNSAENHDKSGNAIVFADLTPASYDGQFVQIDLTGVAVE